MRHKAAILIVYLTSFSTLLFGSLSPSEWDRYCRKCHVDRPVNALYDSSIKAHKNTARSCVSCHRDKGIAGHVKRSAESFRILFEDVTLPADIRPLKVSSVTNDDCLACHPYIFEVDEIARKKIPRPVRQMGLRAGHRQHWDYRSFTPDQQEKLKKLISSKAKSPLTQADQDQLDRLSKIEKMQCSRCHERFRPDSPGGVDPNVSIAMKNPMECTACHIPLRTAIHPGDPSPLPSAVSCERCHYGKLHQKMVFFPVDRGTEKDCLLCHTRYSPEELRKITPEQFIHKSTIDIQERPKGALECGSLLPPFRGTKATFRIVIKNVNGNLKSREFDHLQKRRQIWARTPSQAAALQGALRAHYRKS